MVDLYSINIFRTASPNHKYFHSKIISRKLDFKVLQNLEIREINDDVAMAERAFVGAFGKSD